MIFVEKMLQESTNFIEPSTPVIIVKELTEKTVNEAVKPYVENK